MKIRQVNNLNIEYSKKRQWEIIAPTRECLGQFETEEEAVAVAKTIKDFKKIQDPKYKRITTKNLDELCDLVNAKYNLKHNQIGSIEHYHAMNENAIVQILNSSRGTRQLVFGDDHALRKYLKGLLDGEILLDFINIDI